MPTLSVIVPAYNEAGGIALIVQRVLSIRGALASLSLELELLVVDDGSRDATAYIASARPEVRLVRHALNRGYGAAIKTGFRQAGGELLAFLDADGTYPPESLPALCGALLDRHADLVVGSRMSGAPSRMPLARRAGNLLFARLLSLVGNARVCDAASGMRVLRRDVLPLLYPLPDGLDFTPAMSTRAIHERLTIVEVPVDYAERVGRSKLSVVRDGFHFARAIVWTALAYNPARILGLLSLATLSLAGLFGLYIVLLRLNGVTTLNAWQVHGLFGAVVLAVVGISLLSLGAMFNYLVALFHKRPVQQGLFGKTILKRPIDRYFGRLGLIAAAAGCALGGGAFILGVNGWPMERLWFYLLNSALFVIVGVQLIVSWAVIRVLEELARRERLVEQDLAPAAAEMAVPVEAV